MQFSTVANVRKVDYTHAGSVIFMDTSVVQTGMDTLIMAAGAPQLDMNFEDDIVDMGRKGAGLITLIWVVVVIGKSILPGRGGGGMQAMMGGGGGGGKVAMAVIGIVCLMDLNITVDMVNFLLEQMWSLKDTFLGG